MMAVLMENGVHAERSKKERDGFSVRVEREDFARAVRTLSAAGFPRESFKSINDVFPGGRLVSSPSEHRARFAYGLSQELSRSVGQISGVAWTRVHIALAVHDVRGSVVSPSTASIVIRYKSGYDIAEISAQAREMVAHAVEGLQAENVRVVLSSEQGGSQGAGSSGIVRAVSNGRP
jgi:type III secretion protein J